MAFGDFLSGLGSFFGGGGDTSGFSSSGGALNEFEGGGGGAGSSFLSGLFGGSSGSNIFSGLGGAVGAGLGALAPAAANAGVGFGLSKLFPGEPARGQLIDTRQSQGIAGSNIALGRLNSLLANPLSFGLPGDPNDVNTPAGKMRYDIIKRQRAADAAGGRLTTGGAGVREQDALNRAIAGSYNDIFSGSQNVLANQPTQQYQVTPAQPSPWGKLLAGSLTQGDYGQPSPVASLTQQLLKQWGG